MRIGIIGTRGIPANYGGFETFAEALSTRLVTRGHEVAVYGRTHHVPRAMNEYRGVRLVVLPTIRHKYLDTVVHTMLSAAHALGKRFDVVLVCNAANALVCGLPRLAGARVVLNVDGIERKRKKWNAAGRAWYLLSERLATWLPSAVVTDAEVIRSYYATRYGCPTTFIPYGCDVGREPGTATLERLGLAPGDYVLYVSRLEPENNADAVIVGFQQAALAKKLVVVGDAPYADAYKARLRQLAGERVVLAGGVYGQGYRELQSHAFAYVHATEVGGTHPALVEAMGFGNCVIVNDVPENREVAGEAGLYFKASDPPTLARVLEQLVSEADLLERHRGLARQRAAEHYSWDAVTDAYVHLFESLLPSRVHAS